MPSAGTAVSAAIRAERIAVFVLAYAALASAVHIAVAVIADHSISAWWLAAVPLLLWVTHQCLDGLAATRPVRQPDRSPMEFAVSWSDEDQQWVGTCVQYPSLSYLADDQRAALDGVIELAYVTRDDIEAERRAL